MKKLFSLMLVLVMLFSMSACGVNLGKIELIVPTFDEDKKIITTVEMPPDYSNRKNLEQAIAAGMNTIIVCEDFFLFGSEKFNNVMQWCDELGVDVIIRTSEKDFGDPEEKLYLKFNDPSVWPTEGPTFFESKEHLKNLDFKQYPAIKGFFVVDEPSFLQLLEIEKYYVDWFNQNYGEDYIWFINFTSTDKAYLQGPDKEGNVVSYDKLISYYLENILTKVNTKKMYHSIDCYPLHKINGKEVTRDNWLQVNMNAASYVKNVASYANGEIVSKDKNAYFASCIQAFDGYDTTRMPQSTADIDFINYVNLAYGSKFLLYYGYKETTEGSAVYNMMTSGGVPQPLYYYVQESNAKIDKFDHVLMHYDGWDGLFTNVGTGNRTATEQAFENLKTLQPSVAQRGSNKLDKLSGVKAVKSKYNCVIGQLYDADNQKAFVLVNYDDRTLTRTNKVKMTFEDANGVLVYRNGEPEVMKIKNHVFEIELNNREGVVVIPLKNK